MTFEIVFILSITIISLIAFASDRVAPDLVAMFVMVMLMVTGILSPREGISGFSNPATITILAFFFVSLALEKSGTIRFLGDLLLKLSNNNLMVDVLLISLIAGLASAFINTTAVVIVFLPIVLRLGRMKGISPTLLLMPLSFGAIIGGASTTIGTSTNLIISEAATHNGGPQLAVFEFTHIGFFLFAILIVYMMFASKFILKARKNEDDLLEDYNLRSYITELRLREDCPWIGKKIREIPAFNSLNISVLDIERKEDEIVLPDLDEALMAGDTLLIRVNPKNFLLLKEIKGVELSSRKNLTKKDLERGGTVLMEVIINQNASIIGKKISNQKMRRKYKAAVLGVISSKNRFFPRRLKDFTLHFGDSLLIETLESHKLSLYNDDDFIILKEWEKPEYRIDKRWISVATVAAIIFTAAIGLLPIVVAALAGAVVLVATRCINITEAYKSVEWKIIFILAGMIPLGLAMEKTGTSDLLAQFITSIIAPLPKFLGIFLLYMFITLITSVIYNNATAIILAPIMISLAPAMGMEVLPMLALLMFAANCCFITPIGYQTNLLIYGPGHYRFRDYVKVGGPLCVLLGLVCTALIMFWY